MQYLSDSETKGYNDTIHQYPLVTVGIPTYNGGRKIENAVRSVLSQNYPNLEIIISDNCSGDNTMEVCTNLRKENQSIRYFRQPVNIGWIANFQFVLTQATGDLFMWLCDDDSLEPGILHKYVDFLLHNGDYSLVSGQIQYWNDGQPVFCERDFNIDESFGSARLIHFYFKVVYGSIFSGLIM